MRISDWSSDVCSSDLYDIDAVRMLEVLRIGREKLSDKGTTSAVKRVDPLRSQTGLAREAVIEHMVETFRARHGGLARDALRGDELARAPALARGKLATAEWTALLPRAHRPAGQRQRRDTDRGAAAMLPGVVIYEFRRKPEHGVAEGSDE